MIETIKKVWELDPSAVIMMGGLIMILFTIIAVHVWEYQNDKNKN